MNDYQPDAYEKAKICIESLELDLDPALVSDPFDVGGSTVWKRWKKDQRDNEDL